MFREDIDKKVGLLWKKVNGVKKTMTEIETETAGEEKLSRRELSLAMGWLIYEGKINVTLVSKKIVITIDENKTMETTAARYKRDVVAKNATAVLHLLNEYVGGKRCTENELATLMKAQAGLELKDLWVALGFLLCEGRIDKIVEGNRKLISPC